MLAASVMLSLLYALISALAPTPPVATVGYVCNTVGYGIMLPAMRAITADTVDKRYVTTTHSIIDICYSTLPGVIALLASGALLKVTSVQGLC